MAKACVCPLSVTCGAALLLNLPGLQAVQEGRSRSHSPSLTLQAALLAGLQWPAHQHGPHTQLSVAAPGSSLLLPQLMSGVPRLPAPALPGTPRAWRCPSLALSLSTSPVALGQQMPAQGTMAALPSPVWQHQLCSRSKVGSACTGELSRRYRLPCQHLPHSRQHLPGTGEPMRSHRLPWLRPITPATLCKAWASI